MDIARKMYPTLVGVFIDTGLEYPEIREFIKNYDNIEWLKPKKNFKQVITQFGYPFISKEVSHIVYGARRFVKSVREREHPYCNQFADIIGIDRRIDKENPDYKALKTIGNVTCQKLIGEYKIPDTQRKSPYCSDKYKFFLEAPFEISARCCDIMKKAPAHNYYKQTGRAPITAQMASESRLRTQQWLTNGCNGFHLTIPTSNPMSFWTEQDVLQYIHDYKLPICSVYGDIIEIENKSKTTIKSQDVLELFDLNRPTYKLTGCQRTGCMFCGYGCHLEKSGEGRFLKMKETHPKQYDYIMKPVEDGGLGYKTVIDWINEHGNFHIEY